MHRQRDTKSGTVPDKTKQTSLLSKQVKGEINKGRVQSKPVQINSKSNIKTPSNLGEEPLERSRQTHNQHHSRSLNISTEGGNSSALPHQNLLSRLLNEPQKLNSDRSGANTQKAPGALLQQQQDNGQFYGGDSFQIQQESLANLHRDQEATGGLRNTKAKQREEEEDEGVDLYEDGVFNKEKESDDEDLENSGDRNNIEGLDFEVEIKGIVSRIKEYTVQIKDRVKVQRQLSETFIQLEEEEEEGEEDEHQFLPIGEQENGLDVSVILQKNMFNNDKSGFINDNSYILPQDLSIKHNNNNNHNNSFMLSPYNHENSKIDGEEGLENLKDNPAEEEENQKLVLEKETLQKIINNLQTKHQAEKDTMNSELEVFKRVIALMGIKIRALQEEILDKDKLQMDLYKVQHLFNRLEVQFKNLRDENLSLNKKLDAMRKVMLEFDQQYLDEQTQDDYLIDQLISENHQLQRLLLISNSSGLEDFKSLDEQLKHLESQALLSQIRSAQEGSPQRRQAPFGYNMKKKPQQNNNHITEPLNQSMPNEVKQMILERQIVKEEERRINMEMRRQAEEEIMRELRMTEDYFQKTNKNFPTYSQEDLDHLRQQEDISDIERQRNNHDDDAGSRGILNSPLKLSENQIPDENENVFTNNLVEQDKPQVQEIDENKIGNEQR